MGTTIPRMTSSGFFALSIIVGSHVVFCFNLERGSFAMKPSQLHLSKSKTADPDVKELIRMDKWTTKLVTSLVPPILEADEITEADLEQPNLPADTEINTDMQLGNQIYANLNDDGSFGGVSMGKWAKLKILSWGAMFPVDDLGHDVTDEEVAKILVATKLDQAMPTPNLKFDELQSDEATKRIAFFGIGSHLVEEATEDDIKVVSDAAYKVDIFSDILPTLEVRPGFEKYGAAAYFGKSLAPVAIKVASGEIVRPGDGAAWEHAKYAWRVNIITIVTAVDHLFNLHFASAAPMVMASTQGLATSSPLRRALHPFMMRTALINNTAGQALIPKNSIVHHMTSFTYESLATISDLTFRKGTDWLPLPEQIKAKGSAVSELVKNGQLPYYEDGLDIFKIFRDYYDDIVDDFEPDSAPEDLTLFWSKLREHTASPHLPEVLSRDALLDALAMFTFSVTMRHEQVGAITQYIVHPSLCGTRIRPQAVRTDAQAFLASACLMSLTGISTPGLISEFKEFWRSDEESKRWGNLQKELLLHSDEIANRNKNREFPFYSGDPKNLECAVSV